MQLRVFYHVYIPPDLRSCAWQWYVDEQLGVMQQSQLHKIATVNICVTMPGGWLDLFGSSFMLDNGGSYTTFFVKFQEYLKIRYPWVNVVSYRDTSEPNLFEGPTLQQLHNQSLSEDFFALYIHTKGVVVQSSPSVAAWRQILNHYLISNWPENVKLLNDYQVVAVNDSRTENAAIVSGNFFWARSDYIRSLPDPVHTHLYDPSVFNRYAFETWILSGNPTVCYLTNTHSDPYGQYCFLENLISTK